MSPSEALLAFVLELTRAAKDVGLPAPQAQIIAIPPIEADHAWAYTDWTPEGEPVVLLTDRGVMTYVTYEQKPWSHRWARRWLRCIARHEMAHVALHHVSGGPEAEAAVGAFILDRWKEPSPRCDAR